MGRALLNKVNRLEALLRARRFQNQQLFDLIRQDPAQLMWQAGLPPDSWQQQLLRSAAERMLVLCCRQAGKSTVAAALALRVALLQADAPVLLLSPSLRQSAELFRKVISLFNALGRPLAVTAESTLRLELANGSRILSLPGTEETIRGFSGVALLIIDEAARVSDDLYYAVRPMLAVSQGQLVALSTPFGRRGWFHDEWQGDGVWERATIVAPQCPRISPAFLEEERRALGPRWFGQEYLCSFEEIAGAVFNSEDISAAFADDLEPLSIDGGA